LGLQVYTGSVARGTLFKLHSDVEEHILDYVEELKKCGYEIISFPPIEKYRNYLITNVIAEPPPRPNENWF
jgi:hypothetical protein